MNTIFNGSSTTGAPKSAATREEIRKAALKRWNQHRVDKLRAKKARVKGCTIERTS
jgi:hypothetical protein